jgi:hypothetical protein
VKLSGLGERERELVPRAAARRRAGLSGGGARRGGLCVGACAHGGGVRIEGAALGVGGLSTRVAKRGREAGDVCAQRMRGLVAGDLARRQRRRCDAKLGDNILKGRRGELGALVGVLRVAARLVQLVGQPLLRRELSAQLLALTELGRLGGGALHGCRAQGHELRLQRSRQRAELLHFAGLCAG